MFNDDFFVNELLGKSTVLPPAVRDYSTGTVAWVMRQAYNNMFPSQTSESAFNKFFGEEGRGMPFREKTLQDIRNTPLSSIPGFTEVQKQYNVESMTVDLGEGSGKVLLRHAVNEDVFDLLKRGEQQFKGAKTVGDLQKVIVNSMYESIMQLGARKFAGRIQEGFSTAVIQILENIHTYKPGTVDFAKHSASSQYYLLGKVFAGLQDDFTRPKDPLAVGETANINIGDVTLPVYDQADVDARLRPVPGKPGSYLMPGVFTRTGSAFKPPTRAGALPVLEEPMTVQRQGWQPVTLTEKDMVRFDTLFSHTYHQEEGKYVTQKQFSYVETYRDYLDPIRPQRESGRVDYTMKFPGEVTRPIQEARTYQSMPSIIPTGYYLDPRGKLTQSAGRGQISNRPINFSPMDIKFLLGHQTAEDVQANPALVRKTPGMIPEGGIDPFRIQRRVARRYFNAFESLLDVGGTVERSGKEAGLLEYEAQIYSREAEEANAGMMYNPQDAYFERNIRTGYRYGLANNAVGTTQLAMQLAIENKNWMESQAPGMTYSQPGYRTGSQVFFERLLGRIREDFTPASPEMNVPTSVRQSNYRPLANVYAIDPNLRLSTPTQTIRTSYDIGVPGNQIGVRYQLSSGGKLIPTYRLPPVAPFGVMQRTPQSISQESQARNFPNPAVETRGELEYYSRPSTPGFQMLDERRYDQALTEALTLEEERIAQERLVEGIRARTPLETTGALMAQTINQYYFDKYGKKRPLYAKLIGTLGGKVANILYNAGQNFMGTVHNEIGVAQETPQAYRFRTSNQVLNATQQLMGEDHPVTRALERAYIAQRPGAMPARQLYPTDMPEDVLPEEEAFAETTAKGIAIGKYGYIRGDFMSMETLDLLYTGKERLQKGYLVGEIAGSHEIGHIVYENLPKNFQKKFSALFNMMVNKVGQAGMLSADVEKEKFNFSEEFSAAYSIAATLGTDALKEFYPEYAKFFDEAWEEVTTAEEGVTLVRYKGDKKANAFRARQLQVHGELPQSPGMEDDLNLSRAERRARYRAQRREYVEQMKARAFGEGQQTPLIDRLRSEFPINAATAIGPYAEVRAQQLLSSAGEDTNQWLRWGGKKLPFGRAIDHNANIMNLNEGYRGQEVIGSSRVLPAVSAGQQAVHMALEQGSLPTSQKEWAASMLERVNKFIEKSYSEAINSAAPGAQKMAWETLQKVTRNVAEGVVFEAAGMTGKEAWRDQQAAKDMAYGTKRHVFTDWDKLQTAARSDPGLQQMIESGQITPQMMGGPANVLEYPGGGAVRVGGGGPPSRASRFNLWGGKAGALMYSSYIMRRMWSMVAAPEFQGADEYGQYLGSMAGLQQVAMAQAIGPGATPALAQTDAGYVARQQATQRWMQRGQYQQWGGISQAAYALSGTSDAVPRLVSGLKVAAGAGIVGSLAGSTLAYMGSMGGGMMAGAGTFAAVGGVLPALGIGIGAAIGLGTIGMEAYNAIAQPETPMTWGTLARSAVNQYNVQAARSAVYADRGSSSGAAWASILTGGRTAPSQIQAAVSHPLLQTIAIEGMGLPRGAFRQMESWLGTGPEPTREEILEQMTPEARASAEYIGEPAMMRDIREQLEAVNVATGEDVGQMQAAVRTLARGLKGVPKGLADIATDWSKIGLTVAEGTQAFTNLASQMGYTPGTGAYRGFWEQFNAVASSGDVVQFEGMMSRGQRVSQFGGQIAGYFSSGKEALRLTDQYDLTTAAKMMPVQSLMAIAAQAGIDADTVVAYNATERWEGRSNLEKVTYGKAIADMAQRRSAMEINSIIAPTTQALISSGFSPIAAPFMAEGLGFTNPSQAAAAGTWLQAANLYGQGYGQAAANVIAPIRNISNFQASIIPGMAEPAMRAGVVGAMPALAGGMGANLSDQMAWRVATAAGGDRRMLSYLANRQIQGQLFVPQNWRDRGASPQFQGQLRGVFDNPYQYASMNLMGQPTYQTDFGTALQFGAFWEQEKGGMTAGVQSFVPAAELAASGDMMGAAREFFAGIGSSDENLQAWVSGGLTARTAQFNATMSGLRAQQASLAGAGAALSAQALWGGGAWTGTPAPGSIWAIQDTLRSMGNQNQLANFAYQRQMMQTQNQFAIRQEDIQATRMEAGQQYQRFQMGFQFQGMMQQRMWQQQDWQYQDTMRNMQFGWQMEDYDEAIRTSTGRQRAQLVRQRDRAATTYNLEGEKIDENRSRQEEMWARQDEAFAKQQEYQETMMQLDEEQFELQKEQRRTLYEMENEHFQEQVEYYKERYAVETELIAKQRDYQAAQIALQGAQAALQKEMAEEQEIYSKEVERMTTSWGESSGYFETMREAEPEKIFGSFSDLVVDMKSVSGDQLGKFSEAFTSMGGVSSTTLYEIRRTMDALNSISPTRMQQLANALWNLSDAQDGVPGQP